MGGYCVPHLRTFQGHLGLSSPRSSILFDEECLGSCFGIYEPQVCSLRWDQQNRPFCLEAEVIGSLIHRLPYREALFAFSSWKTCFIIGDIDLEKVHLTWHLLTVYRLVRINQT